MNINLSTWLHLHLKERELSPEHKFSEHTKLKKKQEKLQLLTLWYVWCSSK